MVVEEKWIEITGKNWKDVMQFVKGEGMFVQLYEKDGTLLEYINLSYQDINAAVGEIIAYIDGKLIVFSAEDWVEYITPDAVWEVERLLNVLNKRLNRQGLVMEVIEEITGIEIEYESKSDTFTGHYLINGCRCDVAFANGKFFITLLELGVKNGGG